MAQSQSNDELNRLKHLILDNLEAHNNLFNLSLPNETASNDLTKFGHNLKLARQESVKDAGGKLVISIKNMFDKNKSSLDSKQAEASLFESASIYLAVCSYKNQLVHFLIRIGFVSNCLLASSQSFHAVTDATTDSNCLRDLNESRALEIYKFLSTLFNREFILKADDACKDFKDSICYLVNTNMLKSSNGKS